MGLTGLTDKVTGRLKQAAGDLLGVKEVRHEGVAEERKGEEKDKLAAAQAEAKHAEDAAEHQADKVDRLDSAG